MATFDKPEVRQAFAYATDKATLVNTIFKGAAVAAPTIIPPGMPGYQAGYQGLPYDKNKALAALESAYPDVSKVPPITFTYASSQVSSLEAQALQQMWQTALGIRVNLLSVELNAYNTETTNRQVQVCVTHCTAYFPRPYDWLALNLLSNPAGNHGSCRNPPFPHALIPT